MILHNLLHKLMQLSTLGWTSPPAAKRQRKKIHLTSVWCFDSTFSWGGGWGGEKQQQQPERDSLLNWDTALFYRGFLPLQRGGQSKGCSCPRTLCQCQTVCCLDTAHWGLVLGFGNTQKVSWIITLLELQGELCLILSLNLMYFKTFFSYSSINFSSFQFHELISSLSFPVLDTQ